VRQQRLLRLLRLRDQSAAVTVGDRHETSGHVVAEKRDGGGVPPSLTVSVPPVPAAFSAYASVVCAPKAMSGRSTSVQPPISDIPRRRSKCANRRRYHARGCVSSGSLLDLSDV
jgi:hypothetical protein